MEEIYVLAIWKNYGRNILYGNIWKEEQSQQDAKIHEYNLIKR